MKKTRTFRHLLVFFLLFAVTITQAMEKATEKEIVPVFNLSLSTDYATECDSIRQLTITSDGKYVLIAERNGRVSRIECDTKKKEELIKIPSVKHLPLVATAQKKGLLLVAAAGNYFNKKDNVCMSEYNIWYKNKIRRGSSAPLQAIALDKEGSFLVMVNQKETVAIRNLDTHNTVIKSIWSKDTSEYNIDIVCDQKGNIIVVAKAHSIVPMKWDGNNLEIGKIYKFTKDEIKRVFLPQSDTLVYMTSENEVKKIDITKITSYPDESKVLFEPFFNGEISIDPENKKTAAFWTKNKNSSYNDRSQIVIQNKENKKEYLYLVTKPFKERYDYLTRQGTMQSGPNFLREVAICKNSVVAISADDILYWWIIDFNIINKNNKKPVDHQIGYKIDQFIKKEFNFQSGKKLDGVDLSKKSPKIKVPQLIIASSLKNTPEESIKSAEKMSKQQSFVENAKRSSSDSNISPRRYKGLGSTRFSGNYSSTTNVSTSLQTARQYDKKDEEKK